MKGVLQGYFNHHFHISIFFFNAMPVKSCRVIQMSKIIHVQTFIFLHRLQIFQEHEMWVGFKDNESLYKNKHDFLNIFNLE